MSYLSYPLVAAIDFGTTFSTWAYSTKDDFKNSPLKIYTRQWHGGEHDSNKDLSYNTMLQDECNKSLPALKVFSDAIRYLKNDLLDTVMKTMNGIITAEDILWVLTVPAIWDDQAKQFMRLSALRADIKDENLLLALEPEAASILCSLLPVQTMYGADSTAILATFQPGSRYMILDAGGGTIDITIHEVSVPWAPEGAMQGTGGAWGGTSVDRAFEHFLIGLLGPDVFQCFKNDCADDYLYIFGIPMTLKEKFEEKKGIDLTTFLSSLKFGGIIKGWFSDQDLNVYLVTSKCKTTITRLSVYEKMFWEELEHFMEELVGVLTYDKFCMEQPEDHQRLVESFKMQMELRIISRVFGVQLSIPDSLTQIYRKVTGKDFDSKFSLKENEGPASLEKDKMKLKLSVMKQLFNYSIPNIGAVIYGHDSSLISQRICKKTYGVEMLARFINGRHDNSKKVVIDGDELCKGVFDKYVEIGQTVTLNECVAVRNYRAANEEDPYITFIVYTSTSKNPMYVDDVSCAKLGTVEIPITDRSVPVADRCFTFSFVFGNTELKVEAKETRTGQTVEAKLDLLGHH
ncbi:hypothetical protein ACJMK2_039073 [Sinanodonta woodiana]|uniref:Uncharacterized protein n=1 Tax=Sinanodonta woodiana TaxID=1069815 RepID=A0ABD3WBZ4_SINWO